MIRYAKLNITIDIAAVQKEVTNLLQSEWVPHFNKRHYSGDWDVLSLRCPNGDPAAPFAELLNGGSFQDTKMMAQCREIKRVIDSLQCEKMSARLLNLRKGAEIKEHRDCELSFEKGEARLHIPVFTNPEVEFYLDKQLLKMQEGECWYINANLVHSLKNKGDADRIHLVFDCVVNDWLKQFFDGNASEVSILTEKEEWLRTKEEKAMIIRSLRLQNTDTSRRLADEWDAKLKEYTLSDS